MLLKNSSCLILTPSLEVRQRGYYVTQSLRAWPSESNRRGSDSLKFGPITSFLWDTCSSLSLLHPCNITLPLTDQIPLVQLTFHLTVGNPTIGIVVKNTLANAGDARVEGLIPGSGRSPGVENGNLLQYSLKKKIIYLVVLGPGCSTWDLQSSLQQIRSSSLTRGGNWAPCIVSPES